MSMTRKDYGAAGKLADNNLTVREIEVANAPQSIQAVGGPDAEPIALTDVAVGDTVLLGNVSKTVKTVNKTGDVVDSIVLSFVDSDGDVAETTLLAGEIGMMRNFYITRSN